MVQRTNGFRTCGTAPEMSTDLARDSDENESLLSPAAASDLRDGNVNSSGLLLWVGPALLAG